VSTTLGNTRRIFVYLPPGYQSSDPPYSLLVVFDGAAYIGLVPTPVVLDNLIADRRIPPVVAVLVDNPSAEARNKELDCYRPFGDFVVNELLPWARERWRITDDPRRITLAGSSGGGQASVCVAQQHPGRFGAVLAQSGSYFDDPAKPIGAEWVYRNLVMSPRLPLRFYLDIGRYEPVPMVTSVRVMRDVLEAKGYPVVYQEFAGGHDYAWWRGTLADGLIALLGRK
jgi:enterochelin esterase family protein